VTSEITATEGKESKEEPESLLASISRLKAEQKRLQKEKQLVQKGLKNAEKKRKRLQEKAKQLSDSDLAQVFALRASAAASSAMQKPEEAEKQTAKG
jgi:DNA mismatch repair ATPase MutS